MTRNEAPRTLSIDTVAAAPARAFAQRTSLIAERPTRNTRTAGAKPAPCTARRIRPSGAWSIRYQTVDSDAPHRPVCGSSRSAVAPTVEPCSVAGNA